MMANNEMWKSITNAGVKVGVAIDKSLRLDAQKSQVIEDLFGTDAAKSIFGELQGYKDEMKRLTGIWKDDREFIDDVEEEEEDLSMYRQMDLKIDTERRRKRSKVRKPKVKKAKVKKLWQRVSR